MTLKHSAFKRQMLADNSFKFVMNESDFQQK